MRLREFLELRSVRESPELLTALFRIIVESSQNGRFDTDRRIVMPTSSLGANGKKPFSDNLGQKPHARCAGHGQFLLQPFLALF